MAWVETRITRTTQPQDGCGIDFNNPLAQALVFATVDALGARSASGHAQNVVGTTFNRGATPAGIGVSAGDTQNTSNTVILPASVRASIVGKPFTLVCVVDRNVGSPNAQSIYSHRDASTQSFYIGLNSTQVQIAAAGFADVLINVPPTAKSFVFVGNGATVSVYCDGALAGSVASAILAPATSILPSILNRSAGGGRAVIAKVLKVALYAHAFSAAEAAEEWQNPWQIFEPEVQRIWIDDYVSAGGGATGTLAATETDSDTAVISGQIVVQGTLSATEAGSDTSAVTGGIVVQGSLAATEVGSDTALINGSGAIVTTGSINATESGGDSASMAGKVLVTGAVSGQELGSDTASLAGAAAVTGVRYWNGATWAYGTLRYWNGSAWSTGTLRYWNGTNWSIP